MFYIQAYDKTARLLGLDMKKGGGPALEELAREGDPKAIKFSVRISTILIPILILESHLSQLSRH